MKEFVIKYNDVEERIITLRHQNVLLEVMW